MKNSEGCQNVTRQQVESTLAVRGILKFQYLFPVGLGCSHITCLQIVIQYKHIINKKTPEGNYTGCIGVSKNYARNYVEWRACLKHKMAKWRNSTKDKSQSCKI